MTYDVLLVAARAVSGALVGALVMAARNVARGD
jgi:hypothetical protein